MFLWCQSETVSFRLIPLMVKAQGTPFAVPPATMATMCKHLYQVHRPAWMRITSMAIFKKSSLTCFHDLSWTLSTSACSQNSSQATSPMSSLRWSSCLFVCERKASIVFIFRWLRRTLLLRWKQTDCFRQHSEPRFVTLKNSRVELCRIRRTYNPCWS